MYNNDTVRGYSVEDLKLVRNILSILHDEIKEGYFDGWGLDANTVLIVENYIYNIQRGTYGGKE